MEVKPCPICKDPMIYFAESENLADPKGSLYPAHVSHAWGSSGECPLAKRFQPITDYLARTK